MVISVVSVFAFFSVAGSIVYFQTRQDSVAASDCGSVFNPIASWITSAIDANKNIYQQASNQTGVPWELIAALHYRETSFSTKNPGNGQGIYQLYSTGQYFAPGQTTQEDFLNQTILAANFLQGKAALNGTGTAVVSPRKLVANETDINLIKNALFSYNGRASSYAQQASTYGYSSKDQPFEGSPYVMSLFDCKRSAMGLITSDGSNSLTAKDTRLGAFTLYARLKGDGYWNGLQVGNIPGCNEATNTRLSCVWRLYNPGSRHYSYTTSYDTRNSLIAQGYLYQDVAFFGTNPSAPVSGQLPVYLLGNNAGGSFMTVDSNEYQILKGAGWKDFGIAFYADPAGGNSGYPIYRLYNPTTGTHAWTASATERSSMISNGFGSEGVAFNQVSKALPTPTTPPPPGQMNVYRFGSMPGNTHFWTTDIYERDDMVRVGYRYEGVAWRSSQNPTSAPVYRLYSSSLKRHLYTTDQNEKNVLSAGSLWAYEGIGWYSNPSSSGAPVYRLYSPRTLHHFFTTDSFERSELVRTGVFKDEGIGWYQP